MASEIEIPVPWGHISGKLWGSQDSNVVLCLHGLQDNAGSFDRLIPLLPKGFLYVAIDLPGHGKSSHFSRGVPLGYLNFIYSIKLVIDFYKWNKITFLSHSFGAQLAILFAGIYPEHCQKIILLDGMTTFAVKNKNILKHFRRYLTEAKEVEETLAKKEPPSHTYEEALNRFINNRFSPISRESAEILIKRSLVKSGNGLRFSSDQRLKKLFRFPFNTEQIATILLSIKCPSFLLIAKESYNMLLGKLDEEFNTYLRRLDVVQEVKNFTFKIVEGMHDVHLDNAPLVAESITPFLLFSKSSL